MNAFVTILGLAAGTLSTAAFVPQVLRIWKRRSAILANAVTLALNLSILGLKVYHR